MSIPRTRTIVRVIAILVTCLPMLWAQSADVAVVVNQKNAIANVSLSDLRKMFAGDTHTWPDGIPVKLLIRAPGAHEREVVLRLLHMSEDQYERYWTAQAYRGEGTEPVIVFSNGMQKEGVMAIPGAIALIDAADVKPGVKILKIDGKYPGEPGYPLH